MSLVIAAHGTRDAAGESDARGFAERVAAALPGVDVHLGFVEISEPPMADAMRVAAESADSTPVVVLPLMLAAGGHAKADIPGAIAAEAATHPGVEWRYADVLGPDQRLVDALVSRIGAAADGADPAATSVLLVGRGSSDVDSTANVATTARRVFHAGGFRTVETGFIAVAHPSVEEGLERIARLADDPSAPVVVAPYLLFRGLMIDDVRSRVQAWQAANPGRLTDVRVSDVLGEDSALVDLAVQRYRDAAASPAARMAGTRVHSPVIAGELDDDTPFVPYPSGLRLDGRRVVIVGGGGVAKRRTEGLLVSDAAVTVVSPEVCPELAERAERGEIRWEQRRFRPSDLNDTWYVVACTDDPAVNAAVGDAAEERHIFCVRSDDGTAATAWTPAVGHLGEVTIAVLANRHPHASRGIRDQIMAGLADGTITAGLGDVERPGLGHPGGHGHPGSHGHAGGQGHPGGHPHA